MLNKLFFIPKLADLIWSVFLYLHLMKYIVILLLVASCAKDNIHKSCGKIWVKTKNAHATNYNDTINVLDKNSLYELTYNGNSFVYIYPKIMNDTIFVNDCDTINLY